MPWGAQVHQALGHRDLPYPGTERSFATKLPEVLVKRHHRVLKKVLRLSPVTREAAYQPEGAGSDSPVDGSPRALIARPRPLQEIVRHPDLAQSAHCPIRCEGPEKGRNDGRHRLPGW